MAKLWTIDPETGELLRSYEDDVETLSIDLTVLFPEWEAYDECQKATIVNGVKQKLADILAVPKDMKLTEQEKYDRQLERWEDISVNRNWNVKAEIGARGPQVALHTLIPPLVEAGFDVEAIAQMTGKTVSVIERFLTEDK